MKEAAHDGALRDLHDLRDLLVAEAVDLSQNDDGAVIAGQRVESLAKSIADFAAPNRVGGVSPGETPEEVAGVRLGALVRAQARLLEVRQIGRASCRDR